MFVTICYLHGQNEHELTNTEFIVDKIHAVKKMAN